MLAYIIIHLFDYMRDGYLINQNFHFSIVYIYSIPVLLTGTHDIHLIDNMIDGYLINQNFHFSIIYIYSIPVLLTATHRIQCLRNFQYS